MLASALERADLTDIKTDDKTKIFSSLLSGDGAIHWVEGVLWQTDRANC